MRQPSAESIPNAALWEYRLAVNAATPLRSGKQWEAVLAMHGRRSPIKHSAQTTSGPPEGVRRCVPSCASFSYASCMRAQRYKMNVESLSVRVRVRLAVAGGAPLIHLLGQRGRTPVACCSARCYTLLDVGGRCVVRHPHLPSRVHTNLDVQERLMASLQNTLI